MKKIICIGLILLLLFGVFPAASYAATYSTLRSGSSGEEVKILQSLLNEHGAALTVDGRFGPKTEDAVKIFQKSKALTVDGIVGPQTWTALLDSETIQPVSSDPASYAKLSKGSSGEEVKILQSLLNENGAALTVDGQFGAKTEDAVKKYQDSKGLTVDGIVGLQTWTALLETNQRVGPAFTGYPVLSNGSKGDAVTIVQILLNDNGAALTADGRFGPKTEDAVSSFQTSRGMTPDGIVSPDTWSALLPVPASPLSGLTDNQRQQIVDLAYSALGVRYVYASASLSDGFDCSGLTYWAYNQIGITVPRSSNRYYNAGEGIYFDDMKPGDVLCMDTDSRDGLSSITHVGIYVGDGKMIHASSSLGKVVLQDINQYLSWGVALISVRYFTSD